MMSDLPAEHVLDLLFYNFFDLDRFNRAALGDGVLNLGTKDPLSLYMQKKRVKDLIKAGEKQFLDELAEDLEIVGNTEEKRLENAMREAEMLIEMAERIEEYEEGETGMREDLRLRKNEMKVNYEMKYGRLGKLVEDALNDAPKKGGQWGLSFLNNAKNKFMSGKKTTQTDRGSVNQSKMSLKGAGRASDEDDNISNFSRQSNKSAALNPIGKKVYRKASVILTSGIDKSKLGGKPQTQIQGNRIKSSYSRGNNMGNFGKPGFVNTNFKRRGSKISVKRDFSAKVESVKKSGNSAGSGGKTPKSAAFGYKNKKGRMESAKRASVSDKTTPKLSKMPTSEQILKKSDSSISINKLEEDRKSNGSRKSIKTVQKNQSGKFC